MELRPSTKAVRLCGKRTDSIVVASKNECGGMVIAATHLPLPLPQATELRL